MKILSKSLAETKAAAEKFLKNLRPADNKATVVGLFGDLGSGKTAFTQAVGEILNIQEVMTSPTFVIEKRYDLDGKYGFKKFIHIDAYRLGGGQEILNLNFAEDMANPENLILIEWPELISDALPEDLIRINFKFVSETERSIDF